jgi:hypothetical protein
MKRVLSLVLLAAIAAPAPAWAQAKPAKTEDLDEARTRFQRGVDLYKEGSYDAALAEFTKAYELAPNYRVLFNLAQVQSERHDYVAAVKFFEKYLSQGGADIPPDRRDQVAKELSALRGRVTQMTVQVDVEGAELVVDGSVAGTLPLTEPVLVSAGVRQIQVRKSGYETASRTETIAGGEAVHFDFKLTPLPVAAAAAPAASSSPLHSSDALEPTPVAERPSMVPFWVTLATTGVLAGGAVTFGVLANSANGKLDRQLNAFPGNPGQINDTRSEVKRDALISDILTGAAVVSGGLCIYFGVSGSHSSSTSEHTDTALRLVPAGTGARLLGNF